MKYEDLDLLDKSSTEILKSYEDYKIRISSN